MHETHSILIIQDDLMIGQSLARALPDFDLPLKCGFDVLKSISEHGISTLLFIITAREGVDDKMTMLDLGADDYLLKPFIIKALIVRIRGVLRMSTMSYGEIKIHPAKLKANYRDKSQFLSAKELGLLQVLIERPGTILSKSQVLTHLYGSNEEAGNHVEVGFSCPHPPQFVAGTSGTVKDRLPLTVHLPPGTSPASSAVIEHHRSWANDFGYMTMERKRPKQWDVKVWDDTGHQVNTCTINGRHSVCALAQVNRP